MPSPASAPSGDSSPALGEFELRGPDGLPQGLYNLWTLRAMIQSGALDARAKVRPPRLSGAWPLKNEADGGPWQSIADIPALREVMELVGMEIAVAEGERRIAGWRASPTDIPEEESSHRDLREVSQAIRAAAPAPTGRNPLPIVGGLVVGLILLAMIGGLLLS